MDAGGYNGPRWNVNRRISKQYTLVDVSGRESLELGDAGARESLMFRYAYGRGTPQDYVRTQMWLSLTPWKLTVNELFLRAKVAAVLTREQRTEAQRLAREWDEAHPRD